MPRTLHVLHHALLAGAVLAATAAIAQSGRGSIEQSIPPAVSQKPEVPALHLSEIQRDRIRQVLSSENTEVTFSLKTQQPAKDFEPEVGAVVPRILALHALPERLVVDMPTLKRFDYLKLRQQVVIVDPMSRRIVEMFAEAKS